jgi:hypothetical protein
MESVKLMEITMTLPLFGFDSRTLQVVQQELTIADIVKAGIHPYPTIMDLGNPDLVKVPVGNKEVAFAAAKDLVFGYADKGLRTADIVFHDGKQAVLINGELEFWWQSADNTGLCEGSLNPRETRVLSDEQFREELGNWLTRKSSGDKLRIPMNDSKWINMKNGKLVYDRPHLSSLEGSDPVYGGIMFEPRKISLELPSHVLWVWQAFAAWHPLVYGEALANTAAELPVKNVSFMIDYLTPWESIVDRIRAVSGTEVESIEFDQWVLLPTGSFCRLFLQGWQFMRDGTRYTVAAKLSDDRIWPSSLYSWDQFVARNPWEIFASWIASFDVEHKQVRNLTSNDTTGSNHGSYASIKFLATPRTGR